MTTLWAFMDNTLNTFRGEVVLNFFFKASPYLLQPHRGLTMITAYPGLQYGCLPSMVLLFQPTKIKVLSSRKH